MELTEQHYPRGMSDAHDVMEHYRQRYLSSRDMARAALTVVALVYVGVMGATLCGWFPWYGWAMITLIYGVAPILGRWDLTLPPWWAYWGGHIILLPVDTDRKQELRQWVADNNVPWYHPEDFVYHFRHNGHAVMAKLTWGGR